MLYHIVLYDIRLYVIVLYCALDMYIKTINTYIYTYIYISKYVYKVKAPQQQPGSTPTCAELQPGPSASEDQLPSAAVYRRHV